MIDMGNVKAYSRGKCDELLLELPNKLKLCLSHTKTETERETTD